MEWVLMDLSKRCFSESDLPFLLDDDLAPEKVAATESHLEQCAECRGLIESMIADASWWDDARISLANGSSCVEDQPQEVDDGQSWSNEQLLELIGPTDDPAMIGRVGNYEVVGILGRGGMGAVFKGYDTALNRFVAIKMLLPNLATSGAARKRFAREAQAAAAVVDDHVMSIHGVSEWRSVPYFVMPYSRGVSLQKRLSNEGPLEVREILRIGVQAARGLAAAHAQGIVHRDIKPANIFLDEGVERVQLMDFGLARAVDDASLTRSGMLAGTPQYMSPEQARAETVDHLSDLFSLGSVLYAMCVGHAPFRAESSYSVLSLISDKEPRPIRETNSDVPNWLCAIISKLMSKQPKDRFNSAKQVADLLESCLAHVQEPTTTPVPAEVQALAASVFEHATNHLDEAPIRNPLLGKPIALAAFVLLLVLGGILVVIELNKGTLKIECNANGVPVRIIKEDEIVKELIVSQAGASTRIAAGEYLVEVDQAFNRVILENAEVSLKRGESETVMITFPDADQDRPSAQPQRSKASESILLVGDNDDCETIFKPSPKTILETLEKREKLASKRLAKIYEANHDDFGFMVTKIKDEILPARQYPTVGEAELHRIHYKCTINFTERIESSWPVNSTHTKRRQEIVFVDVDHLHRVERSALSQLSKTAPMPRFAGKPIEEWLDAYWSQTNSHLQNHPTELPANQALGCIRNFQDNPTCDKVIRKFLSRWYAEVEYELDSKTLTLGAQCIANAAGKRHRKLALDYVFEIVDRIPQMTFLDEAIENFYDDQNRWKPICERLSGRDDVFVNQIADRLRHGSTNQRLLALQMLIGTEASAETSHQDPTANANWMLTHRERLLPALLIASRDTNEWARLYSLLALKVWRSVDGKVSLRMEEAFQTDTSLDVQSIVMEYFYERNMNLEAVQDKLMKWARSGNADTVVKALYCMMQPSNKTQRERSIDALILLLSDPDWGLRIESLVPTTGMIERQKMRQFAITLLGEYGSEAHRGLPILQTELNLDRDLTRSFARKAINKILDDPSQASINSIDHGIYGTNFIVVPPSSMPEGHVRSHDLKAGVVTVNLGSGQGVETGFVYQVFRKADLGNGVRGILGAIEITEVRKTTSTARVLSMQFVDEFLTSDRVRRPMHYTDKTGKVHIHLSFTNEHREKPEIAERLLAPLTSLIGDKGLIIASYGDRDQCKASIHPPTKHDPEFVQSIASMLKTQEDVAIREVTVIPNRRSKNVDMEMAGDLGNEESE